MLHACLIEERAFDESRARCDDFCAEVMDRCTGPDAAYPTLEACTAVCNWLSTREPAASETGNTLSCRIDTLHKLGFEGPSDCRTLGPGGNGACGSDCEAYCSLREAACGAVETGSGRWDIDDRERCENACQGLVNPPDLDVPANIQGDTLQCRLARLSEALSPGASEALCEYTRVRPSPPDDGEPACWDGADTPQDADCNTYCSVVMRSCTGEYQIYETAAQCRAVCQKLTDGEPRDDHFNTVRCRRYHAYAAFENAAEHCPHAGPSGDGHCGGARGNCESYCTLSKAGCSQRFSSEYADLDTCTARCVGDGTNPRFPDSVMDGFSDSDGVGPRYSPLAPPSAADAAAAPLQCRVYYAVEAVEALETREATQEASAAPDACASAFADPGSLCP